MQFHKTVFVLTVWAVGILGGLYAAISPYLTPRHEAALLSGLVVAVGVPVFVLWVYWWVTASVFKSEGRRPRQA